MKVPELLAVLEEIRELIDGYIDVKDGDHGPVPNNAMKAAQMLDATVHDVQKKGVTP